jgi:hypothetical protein
MADCNEPTCHPADHEWTCTDGGYMPYDDRDFSKGYEP